MKEEKKLFQKNTEGKLEFKKENWKTLFKIDWIVMFLIVVIVITSLLYMRDTEVCRDFQSNPIKYCNNVANNYNNFTCFETNTTDIVFYPDVDINYSIK